MRFVLRTITQFLFLAVLERWLIYDCETDFSLIASYTNFCYVAFSFYTDTQTHKQTHTKRQGQTPRWTMSASLAQLVRRLLLMVVATMSVARWGLYVW